MLKMEIALGWQSGCAIGPKDDEMETIETKILKSFDPAMMLVHMHYYR
jgi:hypothetical protein